VVDVDVEEGVVSIAIRDVLVWFYAWVGLGREGGRIGRVVDSAASSTDQHN